MPKQQLTCASQILEEPFPQKCLGWLVPSFGDFCAKDVVQKVHETEQPCCDQQEVDAHCDEE
eukprot:3613106-Prymnesium_polylepis.1